MQRKERFPPEADTEPDVLRAKSLTAARPSGVAPKNTRERRETRTVPPAPARGRPAASHAHPPHETARAPRKGEEARDSGVRSRRGTRSEGPAATVDEVVADMSQDPRREPD